jgi:hypothetical protein
VDRYARQRALAAVGDSGQQRIFAASYGVSPAVSIAAAVERQYLERAGARHFEPREDAPAFAHASAFTQPAALDFGSGAWRALLQLRRALEAGS